MATLGISFSHAWHVFIVVLVLEYGLNEAVNMDWLEDYAVESGNISLQCESTVSDLIDMRWYIEKTSGSPVNMYYYDHLGGTGGHAEGDYIGRTDELVEGVDKITLIIMNVGFPDDGSYYCSRESLSVGLEESDKFPINVSIPVPPESCNLTRVGDGNSFICHAGRSRPIATVTMEYIGDSTTQDEMSFTHECHDDSDDTYCVATDILYVTGATVGEEVHCTVNQGYPFDNEVCSLTEETIDVEYISTDSDCPDPWVWVLVCILCVCVGIAGGIPIGTNFVYPKWLCRNTGTEQSNCDPDTIAVGPSDVNVNNKEPGASNPTYEMPEKSAMHEHL